MAAEGGGEGEGRVMVTSSSPNSCWLILSVREGDLGVDSCTDGHYK